MPTHYIAVVVQTKPESEVTTQFLIQEIASNLESERLNLDLVDGLSVVASTGDDETFRQIMTNTAILVTF